MFSSPSALTKKSCRILALRAAAEASKAQRGGGLLIPGRAMSSKFWRERQGGLGWEEHPRSQIAPQTPPSGRKTSPVPSESDTQDALVQKNWQVDLQPPKRPGTLGTATGALRPPLDVLEGAKRAGGGTHSEAPSHVGPYSPARTRIGRRRGPKRRALIYILAYITICSV